ncbi:putative Galactoside 2-alpha-L-fucosyltransferase 1 [Hypsibius exemplaris]|uniref:L-Fucosyltransferase n=1 Tax=Hypsibius exemplaris TaxID=2072580 RepID=A0A1W0XE47_HYPEX|nr:putative Galactoside 2-alpha-L-fucosyltransferase 1 [Hypsibius exemplaris]
MDDGQDVRVFTLFGLMKPGLPSAKTALLLVVALLTASFLFAGIGNDRSSLPPTVIPSGISFATSDLKITRSTHKIFDLTWAQISATITENLQQKIQARLDKARKYHENLSKDFLLQRPTTDQPPKLVIIHESHGRLGNFLFRAASLIGIARRNHYTPIYLINDERTTLFTGLNIEVLTRAEALRLTQQTTLPEVGEKGAGIFADYIADFPLQHGNQSVMLSGYLQSFKYFHAFRDEIRTALTFTEEILAQAVRTINVSMDALNDENKAKLYGDVPRLVGIHVRRGDMISDRTNKDFGYVGATTSYVLNTVRKVQKLYAKGRGTIFVVVTDDIDYCMKVLGTMANVVVVESYSAVVDLAVLSLMETVIMTVGSFGWWGGYLSESEEVYYYQNWPRKRSNLAKLVKHQDYFLPNWQGLP